MRKARSSNPAPAKGGRKSAAPSPQAAPSLRVKGRIGSATVRNRVDLGRLAPAGNRVMAEAITIFRQDESEGGVITLDPIEVTAGAGPLLDAAGIADARRYYTAQPYRYTPDLVNQIRQAVDLGPGGVDEEMVLAVAEWQSTEGSNDPVLVIDGKAGPRTLPRLFRSGLNEEGEGEEFGGEVQTEVIDEWATLATAEARRDRLVELINERLVSHGIAPVTPAFDDNPNNAGSFDWRPWSMFLGQGVLEQASLSQAAAADLADTVYHEARHTEQFFRMAQMRAGQGLSARGIVAEMGVPASVATAARADPLPRGSMQALIAQGWWDSVFGGGSAHRDRVLTELDDAATARTAAQTAFDADPSDANREALDQAIARDRAAFAAYRELPEENDAWATGPAAAAGVTAGTPEAAPAVETDEPSGTAPPAVDGPSHDVLPEEDLP